MTDYEVMNEEELRLQGILSSGRNFLHVALQRFSELLKFPFQALYQGYNIKFMFREMICLLKRNLNCFEFPKFVHSFL